MTDPFVPPTGDQPQQPTVPVYGAPQPPPPYNPPPYGAPVPYGATAPGQGAKNGLGTTALVLGILSIVFCLAVFPVIIAITAIVMGAIGRSRAKAGRATNKGVATWGLITGSVGLVLCVSVLVLYIAAFTSPAGRRFQDCQDAASGDRATSDQCTRDFLKDYFGIHE